jgi:hypothetical protein
MYGQVFSKLFGHTDPLLVFPVLSLFIFVVTFTAVIVQTMRKSKAEMLSMARMPLEKTDQ